MSKENMNLISVIIPVYNVEKYLEECLRSVIAQTYSHLEIILVNDGSTDSSPEICDAYAQKDSRVQVIHKKNGGLSDARNEGIQISNGSFITFIDSDDIVIPDFIEKMLGAALAIKAEVVECNFQKFYDEDLSFSIKNEGEKSEPRSFSTELALKLLLEDRLRQMACAKIFDKKIIEGIFFEKGKIHEDEFWMYQIFGKALKVVKIEEILYLYRQQPESIMGKKYQLKRLDAIEAFNRQIVYMQKYFPSLVPVAVRRLFYGILFHYHHLTVSKIDVDKTSRKMLLRNLRSYRAPKFIKTWKSKDLFWFQLFLIQPGFCVWVRKTLGMV